MAYEQQSERGDWAELLFFPLQSDSDQGELELPSLRSSSLAAESQPKLIPTFFAPLLTLRVIFHKPSMVRPFLLSLPASINLVELTLVVLPPTSFDPQALSLSSFENPTAPCFQSRPSTLDSLWLSEL